MFQDRIILFLNTRETTHHGRVGYDLIDLIQLYYFTRILPPLDIKFGQENFLKEYMHQLIFNSRSSY